MSTIATEQAAAPAPVSTNGQNGEGQSAESRLMELLRQEETPLDHPRNTSPASADDAPETDAETVAAPDPGQTDLPPEDTAPPDAEEAEGTASGENLSSDDAELNEALNGLNDDAKATLVRLAKEIAEGKTSLGKLKQGHRNERKLLERVAELEERLNGESQAETTPAAPVTNLPPEVAKLKDLNEVRAREHKARQAVRQLERVLRTSPNEEGKYTLGDKAYTAEQIDSAIEGWQDELDAIPGKVEQLQQVSQVQAQRREFRQVFERDYPWAKDPDSQQNAAVKEVLKRFPQFKQTVAPEYFAYVWHLGEKAAAAERTGRQSAALPVKPVNGKTNGKVPAAKPHGGTSSAAIKPEPRVSFDSALDTVKRFNSIKDPRDVNALLNSIDR